MTPQRSAYYLAMIAAAQARIAAMMAANQSREFYSQPLEYLDDSFLIEAGKLEELAIAALNEV